MTSLICQVTSFYSHTWDCAAFCSSEAISSSRFNNSLLQLAETRDLAFSSRRLFPLWFGTSSLMPRY